MKKTGLLSLGAIAIAATSILAGCGAASNGGSTANVTAADLAKSVIENMPKEKGYSMDESIDFEAKLSASGVSADMNMDIDLSGDVAQSPVATHLKGDFNVSAAGQEQKQEMELYVTTDESGKTATTYSSSDGKTWEKATASVDTATSVYSADIYQSIVDGKAKATLAKDTEKVDGKDAYKLDVVLEGDAIKDALSAVSTGGENVFSTSNVDFSKATIDADIYIYKDSKLPAKVVLDLKSLGTELMGSMGSSANIDVSKFEADIEFKDYGEKNITVPASVVKAAK